MLGFRKSMSVAALRIIERKGAPVFIVLYRQGAPDFAELLPEGSLPSGELCWGAVVGEKYVIILGELPQYSQKLWDDRDSWFKAPTIRSLVDMGVSIAAAFTGNIWAIAAINLADDALFGMLDVANGQQSWAEFGVNFGKQALIGLGTAAINSFTGGIMGQMGGVWNEATQTMSQATGLYAAQGFGGVIARTMWSGMSTAMTSMFSSAVSAINYSDEAGWGYDTQAFVQGFVGQQAVAGYLGSMASTFVAGSLGEWNQTDNNGNWLNAQSYNNSHVGTFNNLMGGLASAGVQYAMTGETTLNVLNFSDIMMGSGPSVGMLEMHLGGENGFSMNIGSGGTNVSLGNIVQSMMGLSESLEISAFKYGSAQDGKVFDAINGLGYSNDRANWEIGKLLYSRAISVNFNGDLADNQFGSYSNSSPNTIEINDDFLSMNGELAAAKLAAVLSHEGSHYFGNRLEGIANIMGLGVMQDLGRAWGVRDAAFSAGMIDQILRLSSWRENIGDQEYAQFSGKEGSNDVVGVVPDSIGMHLWKGVRPTFNFVAGDTLNAIDTLAGGQLSEAWYSQRAGKDIFDERDYDPVQGVITMILWGGAVSKAIKTGESGLQMLGNMFNEFTLFEEHGLTGSSTVGELLMTSLDKADALLDTRDLFQGMMENYPDIVRRAAKLDTMESLVFARANRLGIPLNVPNAGYDEETVRQIQDAAKQRYVALAMFENMGAPDDMVKQYFFGGLAEERITVGQDFSGHHGVEVDQFVELPGFIDLQRRQFWDLPSAFTAGSAFDYFVLQQTNLEMSYDWSGIGLRSLNYSDRYQFKVTEAHKFWNQRPGQYSYWSNYFSNQAQSYKTWLQNIFK
jgi:hypothetical protein